VNTRLDAVSKAKQAYVIAKATLEQRLREEMNRELANLRTQIDIAVRYAYDSGETRANICRSLGTKDYGTVRKSLERTNAVTELLGDSPYSWSDKDTVTVAYNNYGPSGYSGEASFLVKKLDDGGYLFLAFDPLWSDDYKVRNDVVAAIDGKTDGFYYEDLKSWVVGS
jgi:hypothetical protein